MLFLKPLLSLVLCSLRTEDLFHRETRYRVEKENKENGEGKECEELENGPLVVVPNDVAYTLQGVEEPHEGGVWPAVKNFG